MIDQRGTKYGYWIAGMVMVSFIFTACTRSVSSSAPWDTPVPVVLIEAEPTSQPPVNEMPIVTWQPPTPDLNQPVLTPTPDAAHVLPELRTQEEQYVVQYGDDRQAYAHQLVDIAERSSASLLAVGVVSLRSLLAHRVARILDTSRSPLRSLAM